MYKPNLLLMAGVVFLVLPLVTVDFGSQESSTQFIIDVISPLLCLRFSWFSILADRHDLAYRPDLSNW